MEPPSGKDPSSEGSCPRRLTPVRGCDCRRDEGTLPPVAGTMEERHGADLPAVSEPGQRRGQPLPELWRAPERGRAAPRACCRRSAAGRLTTATATTTTTAAAAAGRHR